MVRNKRDRTVLFGPIAASDMTACVNNEYYHVGGRDIDQPRQEAEGTANFNVRHRYTGRLRALLAD